MTNWIDDNDNNDDDDDAPKIRDVVTKLRMHLINVDGVTRDASDSPVVSSVASVVRMYRSLLMEAYTAIQELSRRIEVYERAERAAGGGVTDDDVVERLRADRDRWRKIADDFAEAGSNVVSHSEVADDYEQLRAEML